MSRIEIKRSKRTILTTIAGGLVVVLLGISVSGGIGDWCLAPIGIVFMIAGILGLRDNDPRVIISSHGISARGIAKGEILWQWIKSARIETIPRAGSFVVLELHDGNTQRFSVEGLQIDEETVLRMIRERITTNRPE